VHPEPEFVVCFVEIAGFNVVAGERVGISRNMRNGFVGACGGIVMYKSVAFGAEVKLLLIIFHYFADNGKWLVAKTEYDIFGRKIKISEPFFDGENPKWNTVEYDELNRPIKNKTFTG
jgi:hypothetical protein